MSSNNADTLSKKIIGAMHAIKKRTKTPAETKIGVFFAELKKHDQAAYEKLLKEYKPINDAWSEEQKQLLKTSLKEL